MADRPILFSAAMVRSLLAGTKTQTRRVLKPQPNMVRGVNPTFTGLVARPYAIEGTWRLYGSEVASDAFNVRFRRGDRLWVRESAWYDPHVCNGLTGLRCFFEGSDVRHQFAGPTMTAPFASSDELFKASKMQVRRPGIHMPRWASRLTLTVTDVRVQRLQECSDADAIAEGIERRSTECSDGVTRGLWYGVPECGTEHAVTSYSHLWDSINNPRALCPDDAPNSWAANPWIVALTFTVERRNIDAARAA